MATNSTSTSTSNLETIAYVVHNANDEFKLENITLDELRDDEVAVELKYSGICHTDIIFQRGGMGLCEYPAILGHEGAGIIKAIGSKVKNKDLKVGDLVLLSINYCEECDFCTSGHPADCIHGTRLHLHGVRDDRSTAAKLTSTGQSVRSHFFGQSSFAKDSFVHETSVVKCDIPAEDAAMFAAMGCGFQTGAGTVMNILKPPPKSSIVIFGMGTVGLAALMAAKYLGLRQIIAIDNQESKLPMAKELGATDIINSKNEPDIVKRIKDLTSGGADYCVDCTGVLPVIESMIEALGMRGRAATVGVPPAGSKLNIDAMSFLLASKSYIACREGDSLPTEYIPQLVKMQREGNFPVEKLCKVYDYKDLATAIKDLAEGRVVKPVIQWS